MVLGKDKIVEEARKKYDAISKTVKCTCLNREVYFNAKGFHHLLFDGSGHVRTLKERQYKLLLIPLIVPVLKNATDAIYRKSVERINRKKSSPKKEIEYWGLVARVGKTNIKVKIILRRVGNGNIIFWSVMKLK
jgi:hypothetical protein